METKDWAIAIAVALIAVIVLVTVPIVYSEWKQRQAEQAVEELFQDMDQHVEDANEQLGEFLDQLERFSR